MSITFNHTICTSLPYIGSSTLRNRRTLKSNQTTYLHHTNEENVVLIVVVVVGVFIVGARQQPQAHIVYVIYTIKHRQF